MVQAGVLWEFSQDEHPERNFTEAQVLWVLCVTQQEGPPSEAARLCCAVSFSSFKVYFCVPLSEMHLPTVQNRRNSYSAFSSNENFSGSFAVIDVA